MDLAKLVTSIEGMKSNHKLVMLVILNFMNSDTRKCYPSIDKIASQSGLSQSTVKSAIKALREDEWIVVDSGLAKGNSNNYFFSEVKIVSLAKSQGIKFTEKSITPLPQVEKRETHKRNTVGLKQNQIKEAPLNVESSSFEYAVFSGDAVPEWLDQIPEMDSLMAVDFSAESLSAIEATVNKRTDSIIIPPKNADGSPPFFRNGTRRYSWNDTQNPA